MTFVSMFCFAFQPLDNALSRVLACLYHTFQMVTPFYSLLVLFRPSGYPTKVLDVDVFVRVLRKRMTKILSKSLAL